MDRKICFLLTFVLAGCSLGLAPKEDGQRRDAQAGDVGGGDPVFQLPVANERVVQCVQGAGGVWSHDGASTLYDLDFDTSNSADEEVYAPATGVAHVHTESAVSGFGYHVNIDLGDGTHAVVAHFKSIFIEDGAEVAMGQLLGYEGCTGSCTGDHIHVGRHEGDASEKAEYGDSIPVSYRTQDTTADTESEVLPAESFVCGLAAFGDAENGHWYASELSVPMWHPDGTLVKTPDDPAVYRLDQGEARWIVDEQVFATYGYDFEQVILISDEELDCYGSGVPIDQLGLVDAVFDTAGELWLIVAPQTRADRYRIRVLDTAWEETLASWGLDFDAGYPPPLANADDPYLTDWPAVDGHAKFRDGSLLTESGNSDVYVISNGIAYPILDWESYLLLGNFPREILTVSSGAVLEIMEETGDCSIDDRCLDREDITVCGGGPEQGGGEFGGNDDPERDDPIADDPYGESPVCTDNDLDGHCNEATGGDDCWDGNADVYPGAIELCGNGIDEDCSGTDLLCGADVTDTDGDGVMDAFDNCPIHDNSDQQDEDGDSLGDACDVVDDTPEVPEDLGTLEVSWTTPFGATATSIELKGEYLFADGSYGFTWRPLVETLNTSQIVYELPGAGSGDSFRFSVEYVDAMGNVSWSCIAPFPPGTLEGTPIATFEGTNLTIQTADDPLSDGCGLLVEVP